MWSVHLYQTVTGDIGPRIEVASASWSISLNEIETMRIGLRKSELPQVEAKWLHPWWAGILFMYNNIPVVAGPIISHPQEEFETLILEAKGIRRILANRLVADEFADWKLLPYSKKFWSGYSLGTIAKFAVQTATNKTGGSLPISYPQAEESVLDYTSTIGMTPCRHEDGSGQAWPCFWNAQTMGNKAGRSFIITKEGKTEFLNESDEDSDHQRTYQGFNVANINADAILTKLSGVAEGPDIMFRPRLLDDSRLTFDLRTGTEREPRIAQDYFPLWDTTRNQSSVSQLSVTNTGGYQTNRVYATGAGKDQSLLIEVATDTAPLSKGYPLLETTVSSGDTENRSVIRAQAVGTLKQNSTMLQEATMTVRADGDIPLGHFWPGDKVQLIVKGWKSIPDGLHDARLLNMSGALTNDIRLSLQFES